MSGLSKCCSEPKSLGQKWTAFVSRSSWGRWGPAVSVLSQKCFATSWASLNLWFNSSILSFWAVIQRRPSEADFGFWGRTFIHFSTLLCLRLVQVKMPTRLAGDGWWIISSHEHWRWLMNGFPPLLIQSSALISVTLIEHTSWGLAGIRWVHRWLADVKCYRSGLNSSAGSTASPDAELVLTVRVAAGFKRIYPVYAISVPLIQQAL